MYDYVVIGAGIIGSWTAYHLSKSNHSTLLLEQFPLPHTRGSSHGQSRIFHTSDVDPFIQRLCLNSIKHWRQIETDTGLELMVKNSRLNLVKAGSETLRKWKENFEKVGMPYEVVTAENLRKEYQIAYSSDTVALFEPDAAIFKARKCLDAVQSEFKRFRGQIIDNCQVKELVYDGSTDSVFLSSTRGSFEAQKVVVCAGPWSRGFHSDVNIPLRSEAIAVTYWREKTPGAYDAAKGFPTFSHTTEVPIYGVPVFEYPRLVKMAYHGGPPADPETRNNVDQREYIKFVQHYIAEHFPGKNVILRAPSQIGVSVSIHLC